MKLQAKILICFVAVFFILDAAAIVTTEICLNFPDVKEGNPNSASFMATYGRNFLYMLHLGLDSAFSLFVLLSYKGLNRYSLWLFKDKSLSHKRTILSKYFALLCVIPFFIVLYAGTGRDVLNNITILLRSGL